LVTLCTLTAQKKRKEKKSLDVLQWAGPALRPSAATPLRVFSARASTRVTDSQTTQGLGFPLLLIDAGLLLLLPLIQPMVN
jgi:hypothetical protein